jgi:hypothetical protein
VFSLNPLHGGARLGSIGLRLPWQDMRKLILDEQGQCPYLKLLRHYSVEVLTHFVGTTWL